MTFPTPDEAARRNLLLLVQLRWLAVGGQLATILGVRFLLGVRLPMVPMLAMLGILTGLNLALTAARHRSVPNALLFASLLVDVACLTVQLALSGAATNPFATLYLLQVVLGAVLLETWSSWTLVAVTSVALGGLALFGRATGLPPGDPTYLSPLHVAGLWLNYTLAAVLLVQFVTRTSRNLRDRDARLAALRQRAAEEEHIVRMGLLASGAAHELGTPLSSLSVALGDWKSEPAIARDPQLAAEVADMRAEVARCKEIVAGILFAAGEVTGEAPERTTLRRFLAATVRAWPQADRVTVDDMLRADLPIVADRALAQAITGLFDNAMEAGASRVALLALRDGDELRLTVSDDGRGFPAEILAHVGKPYQSSKARRGAGLGLFLATNVLRTLGGTLSARNLPQGGAAVTLVLPAHALALEEEA